MKQGIYNWWPSVWTGQAIHIIMKYFPENNLVTLVSQGQTAFFSLSLGREFFSPTVTQKKSSLAMRDYCNTCTSTVPYSLNILRGKVFADFTDFLRPVKSLSSKYLVSHYLHAKCVGV